LSKPVPERENLLDFSEAGDDGLAIASAGPYANHLHFASDIFTPAAHHSIFYGPDAVPDAQ